MPRTALAVQTIPKNGGIQDVTLTAADAANDHEFVNDGDTFLLALNEDAGTPTVVVKSVANEHGRSVDSSSVVPAASGGVPGLMVGGPYKLPHWNQAGSALMHVDLTVDTNLHLAAVKFSRS